MTKRSVSFVMVIVAMCAFLVSTGVTKSVYDTQDKVSKYGFLRTDRPLTEVEMKKDDMTRDNTQGRASSGSSLGAAVPGESPGLTIKNTYEDWQYFYKGRRIDNAGLPSIHFTYSHQPTQSDVGGGFGYNVYDPTGGGGWPTGLGVGCHIQNTDVIGYWPVLAVTPDDRVILMGMDNISGQGVEDRAEFHAYENGAFSSCFVGAGNIIDDDLYSPFWIDPTNDLRHPGVAVQLWNGDTITHAIAGEGIHTALDPSAPNITEAVALYFRKVNGAPLGAATTWEGPIVLDTATYRPEIAASPFSGKVAVVYMDQTAWSVPNNNWYDNDIYYRMSTDGGATWNPRVNATNYDRMLASYGPHEDKNLMFDSDDEIHLTWSGTFMPPEYFHPDSVDYFYDFSASLFHWSTRTSTISRIANRDWGLDWNTQVCGMGNSSTSYLAWSSITECNGRLYVIYTGFNDVFGETQIIDDCASYAPGGSRVDQANGEIWMHVSTGLDGVLWDAARNITNTYTPGCDSAGGGGTCYSDIKASMSPYGYDSAAIATAFGEELTFPGSERHVVDPDYTGSSYLNIMYLEDHFPGMAALSGAEYLFTDNNLNWMRIGWIDPVSAASIAYPPASIGYPQNVRHGADTTITVTVTNDGNNALDVTTIVPVMTSPAGSWLTTSTSSLTVPAGVNNTATFDVMLNADGNINSPGTIVALSGEVYLLTNAPVPRDSVSYVINNFIIADTVVGLVWDTVSTGTTRVIASSHGEMGGNGDGGLNFDFTGFGADCDSVGATVYMYSGGPMLMQVSGADTFMNYAMHSGNGFADPKAFKRDSGLADPADVSGANYEAFFSGTFLNWDSTIAIEKTTYAPTGGGDSTNFIIQCMRVFPLDGMTHNNLAIGEMVDWDVPTDAGSNNNAFVTVAGKTVYFQGIDDDDPADTLCQDNANRLAAQGFLGMYSNSEYNSDSCANDSNFWGVYAGRNDSDIFLNTDDSIASRLWENTLSKTGLNGLADTTDIHGVMTFVHGADLAAGDTLTFYSVFASVQNGNVAELEGHLSAASAWYQENFRPGCSGCCVGLTGNFDGSPDDLVDMGDLTAMIAYLFLSGPAPDCLEEGNTDGSPDGFIDMGDLTAMIAFLFIPPNTPPAPCQ